MYRNIIIGLAGLVLSLLFIALGMIAAGNISLTCTLSLYAYNKCRTKDKADVFFALLYLVTSFVGGFFFAYVLVRNSVLLDYYAYMYLSGLCTLVLLTMYDITAKRVMLITVVACLVAFISPLQFFVFGGSFLAVTTVLRDFVIVVYARIMAFPDDGGTPPRKRKKTKRNKYWTWLRPARPAM